MTYARLIADVLARLGRLDVPPAVVEAWMRLQYSTLDHLDPATFATEVEIAVACHDDDPAASLQLARSYP